METNKKTRPRKEMVGTVVSARMAKTIAVVASHHAVHPIFKKTIKRFTKFKAHDEKNSAKVGDIVRVRLARPLSKDKCWKLVEIVKKTT
ncbi:MAG: 30S ribosomal protein S17 [Omnitrophica bacterium]|nr:30S ribosomal protein S17 [Candidatus Omnitrophota bacterium]